MRELTHASAVAAHPVAAKVALLEVLLLEFSLADHALPLLSLEIHWGWKIKYGVFLVKGVLHVLVEVKLWPDRVLIFLLVVGELDVRYTFSFVKGPHRW